MPTRRLRRPRLLCALSALLLVCGRAEPAAPPPSKLPQGAVPLAPASAGHFEDLLHAAEKYRGLKAKRRVPAGALAPRALEARMAESVGKEYSPRELTALETSLKAFGLIPETMDLRRYLPELLSSQVAGFYDTSQKSLVLVTPSGADAGRTEKDKREEDMVLVHELTHALQDQSFDLRRFGDRGMLSDAGAAGQALVEGDATLTMFDFDVHSSIEMLPGLDTVLDMIMQDPKKVIEEAPDLPGSKELIAAPAWIRDNLLFSYFQGAAFCTEVRRQGGQRLLDYAFTTDPPRSTEQILHPGKWYNRRDDPVGLHLPDLGRELPGYRKAAEGELGELSVRILLREGLQDAGRAAVAAAGWGGDRFAVYENNTGKNAGGRLVVWVTDWDTEPDAKDFRSALEELAGWRVAKTGSNRVVAVRGSLPDERWPGVQARLAATVAERPMNRKVDLVAMGAAAPMPDDDAIDEMVRRIKFKEQYDKVPDRKAPPGQVSADGRSYANAALGVSIRIPPPLQGWTFQIDPANPQILLMISSPNGEVHITLAYQALSPDLKAISVSKMVEMGMKSALTGFRQLEEMESNQVDLKIRDVAFDAAVQGRPVRGTLRTLARGLDLISLTAMGPAESWVRDQETVLKIINTFRYGKPKSATP
jgi:hypothetical protein